MFDKLAELLSEEENKYENNNLNCDHSGCIFQAIVKAKPFLQNKMVR